MTNFFFFFLFYPSHAPVARTFPFRIPQLAPDWHFTANSGSPAYNNHPPWRQPRIPPPPPRRSTTARPSRIIEGGRRCHSPLVHPHPPLRAMCGPPTTWPLSHSRPFQVRINLPWALRGILSADALAARRICTPFFFLFSFTLASPDLQRAPWFKLHRTSCCLSIPCVPHGSVRWTRPYPERQEN